MRRLRPLLEALVLIAGLGLAVYGFNGGGFFRECFITSGRGLLACADRIGPNVVFAFGAMLIVGALGSYGRPR